MILPCRLFSKQSLTLKILNLVTSTYLINKKITYLFTIYLQYTPIFKIHHNILESNMQNYIFAMNYYEKKNHWWNFL